MRQARDLKNWEAEIKDSLPGVGILPYMVVNSGDYLQYVLSEQDILLADDDPSNRKVTQLMLRRLGYEVNTVANGLEVLRALEERPYDLVLMDILMPQMDGLTAAEEIRRRWPTSSRPRIIAYTAYILSDNGCKNLLKNMDGYLFKPVKKEAWSGKRAIPFTASG